MDNGRQVRAAWYAMQPADALLTWLGLMTPAELARLTATFDWATVHLNWSERPKIASFLNALDALVVGEQARRSDHTHDLDSAAFGVSLAMAALDKGDLQVMLRSWSRLARNRENDASEPLGRFHTAVSDLLTRELAARIRR